MNPSIRCEPLPFPMTSGKGAAEGALLFPPVENSEGSECSDFNQVLESQLEETSESTEKREAEADAWAVYGVAPTVLQILQQLPTPGEVEQRGSVDTDPVGGEVLEKAPDAGTSPPTAGTVAVKAVIEILKPSEQKVPLPAEKPSNFTEQIALTAPKPAEKTRGMVAAQGGAMLLTSQNTEETAPEQELSVLAETFEANSLELPIRVFSNAPRETAPKRDLEMAEFVQFDPVSREWSSFEGISDSAEVQAPTAAESVEVTEAVRTHVELLKSSGQGKLDVVLRPDGNTELRLHVEKVNGQILVQARCDRGDFARLEANWNSVQNALATQGIRVESLQAGTEFQPRDQWQDSSNSFEQHSSARQEQREIFIEQEFSKPKGTRQPATSGAPIRGWQSWA